MTAARQRLLAWYDRAARDLPWRRTRDPYAVWVSEVMLQQTRVETVVPYYERFLARFPTPAALADASEDEVLREWSGLGYYRRARLLHAGARDVLSRHGGRVPRDAAARRALPGVGRYTAGAIGSIAFDLEEPVVDGNVARVLARLHGIETPLGRADTERRLWAHAEDLVRGARPGALNQALMELGATVCRKAEPACATCPLAGACAARRQGRTRTLPVPRLRKAPRRVSLVAACAHDGAGRVWLVRSEGALFGGLWSPPLIEGSDGRDGAVAALRRVGLAWRTGPERSGRVEHVLTHRRLEASVWWGEAERVARTARVEAFDATHLERVGVSRFARKLLGAVSPTASAREQVPLPYGR